jgi:hypothetical protein
MEFAASLAFSAAAATFLVTASLMLRDVQRMNVHGFPRDLVLLATFMAAFGVYRALDGAGWSAINTFVTAAFLGFQAWFVAWFLRHRAATPAHLA